MTDTCPRFHSADVLPLRSRERRYVGAGDAGLDARSRQLLNQVHELKRLELERRRAVRDSEEFNDLAAQVERAARDVFDAAAMEKSDGG